VFPQIQAAVVSVKTAQGVVSERVDFPKGEPENPLTEEEFRERYNDLMAYGGVDEAKYSFIYDAVKGGNAKVRDLTEALTERA
jgi:2-methylcitrate dehydratase PrpD